MSFIFHGDSMSAYLGLFIVFHLVSIMKHVDLKSSCIHTVSDVPGGALIMLVGFLHQKQS